MVQVLLLYVTKFLKVLIFADEKFNIFIFVGAPKNYVSHVLIFAESLKLCKTAKIFTRKNLV